MMGFEPKRPTHKLKAIVDGTKATAVIGKAWQRDDGSFLIRLEPFVVLDWRDDVTISLFPYDADAKNGTKEVT